MQTTSPRPSLLDRAPSLPGLALADLTDDEREQGEGRALHPCGEFSAARFAALYPDRYETIARALAEGFSLEAAARVFHIHERTAAAIREREGRSLSAERYRGVQARHARAVVLAATDEVARRLREDPGAVSVRDLVAAARELHNIERSLEGAPSTIAGVIRADGATAALADLLQQAAAAGASVNRFGRGKNPPREDRPAVVVEAVEVPACVPESHSISNDSPLAERVSVGSDTAVDTPAVPSGVAVAAGASGQEDAATGAGGVPREQGGPFRVDPSAPENFGSVNQVSAGDPAGV
jgi:hypothetical protein